MGWRQRVSKGQEGRGGEGRKEKEDQHKRGSATTQKFSKQLLHMCNSAKIQSLHM